MLVVEVKDALYWADLINEKLAESTETLQEIVRVLTIENHPLADDVFKLFVNVSGIQSRNNHVKSDLHSAIDSIDKLPVIWRNI